MRLVLDEDFDCGNAYVNGIADHFAIESVYKHSRAHYARLAVMERGLRVIRMSYVCCSCGDSRFHVGEFCARMSDGSDYADFSEVFNEVESSLHFGSERNDLYVPARDFVIFIKRFGSGFSDVFERLRAHVFGGNERSFEVNAENFRALLLTFLANGFYVFKGFADVFGALSHGRGEETGGTLFRDVFRDCLKGLFGAVHCVRSARTVDMLVDKSGEYHAVGIENRLYVVEFSDRDDLSVLERDIRFDKTFARDVRGYVFKSFHSVPPYFIRAAAASSQTSTQSGWS